MALNGTNGDDEFKGTLFADEIFGFAGNDVIRGSPGADTINGGADQDTVDYSFFEFGIVFPAPISGDAVNVDLERSVQFGGLAEGDVPVRHRARCRDQRRRHHRLRGRHRHDRAGEHDLWRVRSG
jgi:hypothetical protein